MFTSTTKYLRNWPFSEIGDTSVVQVNEKSHSSYLERDYMVTPIELTVKVPEQIWDSLPERNHVNLKGLLERKDDNYYQV